MKKNTKWWCVIELGPGLGAYLRWQIKRNWWELTPGLRKPLYPSWSDHISVVRGEAPRTNQWKWHNGDPVMVYYDMDVRQTIEKDNGKIHWYVRCFCPEVALIRDRLGLPTKGIKDGQLVPFTNHITVARDRP